MEKKKKQIRVAIWAFALLILIVSVFSIFNKENVMPALKESDFEFVGYSIQNESFIKEICPFIRVGRCDLAGGEFGEKCWFRTTEFRYELSDVSPENMQCSAAERGIQLGESIFLDAETNKSLESLNFDLDIRKENNVVVCCQIVKNDAVSNKLCLPPTKIKAIC